MADSGTGWGSGAGKGGGAGGSIREAGGAFGKMEAFNEEDYFRKKGKEYQPSFDTKTQVELWMKFRRAKYQAMTLKQLVDHFDRCIKKGILVPSNNLLAMNRYFTDEERSQLAAVNQELMEISLKKMQLMKLILELRMFEERKNMSLNSGILEELLGEKSERTLHRKRNSLNVAMKEKRLNLKIYYMRCEAKWKEAFGSLGRDKEYAKFLKGKREEVVEQVDVNDIAVDDEDLSNYNTDVEDILFQEKLNEIINDDDDDNDDNGNNTILNENNGTDEILVEHPTKIASSEFVKYKAVYDKFVTHINSSGVRDGVQKGEEQKSFLKSEADENLGDKEYKEYVKKLNGGIRKVLESFVQDRYKEVEGSNSKNLRDGGNLEDVSITKEELELIQLLREVKFKD